MDFLTYSFSRTYHCLPRILLAFVPELSGLGARDGELEDGGSRFFGRSRGFIAAHIGLNPARVDGRDDGAGAFMGEARGQGAHVHIQGSFGDLVGGVMIGLVRIADVVHVGDRAGLRRGFDTRTA